MSHQPSAGFEISETDGLVYINYQNVTISELQRIRSLGYAFDPSPGWRLASAGQDADKLLQPSVGPNELQHLLRHPACASNTSTRILQQLPRKLGEPACRSSEPSYFYGVFFNFHLLAEKLAMAWKFVFACLFICTSHAAVRRFPDEDEEALGLDNVLLLCFCYWFFFNLWSAFDFADWLVGQPFYITIARWLCMVNRSL